MSGFSKWLVIEFHAVGPPRKFPIMQTSVEVNCVAACNICVDQNSVRTRTDYIFDRFNITLMHLKSEPKTETELKPNLQWPVS